MPQSGLTKSVRFYLTTSKAYEAYAQSKRRIFDILEALDSNRPLKLDHYWAKIEARSGAMPKGTRYFLMNKIFLLTPQQIAELEGLKNADSVSALIIRVSDQLKAKEIELFPVSEIEAVEAKERLDAVRERRRKHRANNLEQIREYDRNRKKTLPK